MKEISMNLIPIFVRLEALERETGCLYQADEAHIALLRDWLK